MYLIFMVFIFKKGIKRKDQQKCWSLQEMLFYFFSGVQPLGRL